MTAVVQQSKPVTTIVNELFGNTIAETNMHAVGEQLRDVATQHGLGVALLVAWQHGLRAGHIPLDREENQEPLANQASILPAGLYVFVHVGIRRIRNKNKELVEAGIINERADPMWFFYHEDALISPSSFDLKKLQGNGLLKHQDDLRRILQMLASQQILVQANVNNRQIQFKDLESKRFLESLSADVYVLVDERIEEINFWLPSFGLSGDAAKDLRKNIVDTLKNKRPCNYCSVQALNPREATLHSQHLASVFGPKVPGPPTRRNYQFGFTFAPFGDPREVCHFLAWDFPHISDTVLNMDPQAYSFADLIELVRVINVDVARFAAQHDAPVFGPIAGMCNHWAGNSIYHQHYQFFCIPRLPLLLNARQGKPLAEYRGVTVSRLQWEAPAYLIVSKVPTPPTSSTSTMSPLADFTFVAERVALEWAMLNGPDEYDTSLGNGIRIRHHTQNTYVTMHDGEPVAIFIPRHRSKLDTTSPANKVQKQAAGTLEMMGYFLVDDLGEFRKIEGWDQAERSFLASSWLRELSPDYGKIHQFEANLHDRLSGRVVNYLQHLDVCLKQRNDRAIYKLRTVVETDDSLEAGQKAYLIQKISDEYNRLAERTIM